MTDLKQSLTAGAVAAATAATAAATAVPAQAAPHDTPGDAPDATVSAEANLEAAKEGVAQAKTLLKTVDAEIAAEGVVSPPVLQELAIASAADIATGPELRRVAALVDQDDPDEVLSGTPVEDLVTLAGTPKPNRASPEKVSTEPIDPQTAAAENLAGAKQDAKAARALVDQLNGNIKTDGPGAKKLAKLCADAGVLVEVCTPSNYAESHLKFDSVMISRTVNTTWGDDIEEVGGYRAGDPYPDHPSGRAVDIMIPNGGKGKANAELGDEIARYFQDHAEDYGIEYMIWQQSQWKAGDAPKNWKHMSDRGDRTANHMDHVHITVSDGHSGDAFDRLLAEAQASVEE